VKTLKTKTLPIEPGESWSPDVSRETGVRTTPKTGRLPPAPPDYVNQDYPVMQEIRKREAFAGQMPEGQTWIENSPPSLRDQLAQLLGDRGYEAASLVSWPFEAFDDANYAVQSRDPYSRLVGPAKDVAMMMLLGKLGGPALRWIGRNPEMAAIGAFRAGDAYSRSGDGQ